MAQQDRARPAAPAGSDETHPLPPTVDLGGIPVSRLGFEASIDLLGSWMEEPGARRVATANLDFLEQARRRPQLRVALQTADLVTADGTPLVWLAGLQSRPIPERVAGSDLVPRLIAEAARRGRSVYFLGGSPGAGEEAARRMQHRHPGLRVAGIAAPMISLEQPAGCLEVARAVRETRPDLLLVALGCPKQDVFLARYVEELGCRVGIGVGATVDFLAGRIRRAPRILGPLGGEWLFRLALEPRRLLGRYSRDLVHLFRLAREAWASRSQADDGMDLSVQESDSEESSRAA